MQDYDRLNAAIKIILFPSEYKICEGCSSILTKKTIICPSCHAYRFEEKESAVIEQAVILAEKEQESVTLEDLY